MHSGQKTALASDHEIDGRQRVMVGNPAKLKLKQSLLEIIRERRIASVFQPIVDFGTGKIFSYEALSRVVGPSPFSGPEDLFEAARKYGMTTSLERVCLASALNSASLLGIDTKLSINLCPSVFGDFDENREEFTLLFEELYAVRDRVVVELTEKFLIRHDSLFHQYAREYQHKGFKVAIDDLGAGYAGLKMLTHIEPQIVKLDRFLVGGMNYSPKKQLLISTIVDFCHHINALVVAEGIETMEELECAAECKVDLGQGYLFSRPGAPPAPCNTLALEKLLKIRAQPYQQWSSSNFVGKLACFIEPVNSDTPVELVMRRFRSNPELSAIPVVDSNRPVGIVHKSKLFYRLGQRFGYDLFSRKPASQIMESAFFFEARTPIEEVSRSVVSRSEASVYDAVVIVMNSSYLGLASVHHILEAITDQKINLAKQANPLTGLPGNNLIKQQVENRLSINSMFAAMYFDLDNFKPFNDCFGFELGDRAIRLLANLLRDTVMEWDPLAFIGHIGGDDFVAVCGTQGMESLCEKICSRFDKEILGLHPDHVGQEGHYIALDRSGKECRFGLLSLSIAVVTTESRSFESYAHLASVASEVKKKAKSQSGSSYCIDKRRL